ncbi:MAG: lytic transglycosylase domain-containing protein [Alphaproteobacteria bacterium]
MTVLKGFIGASFAAALSLIAPSAWAAAPQALTADDALKYQLAFTSVDQGDFVGAALLAVDINDTSLSGYLTFRQLMHPTAHKSNYGELANWVSQYADLPPAQRMAQLAARRKLPSDPPLAQPILAGLDWSMTILVPPGTGGPFDIDGARQARLAFYNGDPKRALDLALEMGDRWVAGMAAYRLKSFEQAETSFSALSHDPEENIWVRAGAAYWAARSADATAVQDPVARLRTGLYLRQAASAPQTFYGMIAERQAQLQALGDPLPLETAPRTYKVRTAVKLPIVSDRDLIALVQNDPRAHRAAALAQIGRAEEAGQELRAGIAQATPGQMRDIWSGLALALNSELTVERPTGTAIRTATEPEYPTPALYPSRGFTIPKALVYAIVRQESRFNSGVVSSAGAVGLMQLMPDTAVHASGNTRLRDDMSPLFNPSFNLSVGQDYVTWLMNQGVGYDILRTVAAYNGGPATLQKTAQMLGEDDDSLMVIECMPAPETRDYVEKVMAAYWAYRKKFGQDLGTLDAVASGQKYIDARWDEDPPPVALKPPASRKSKARRSARHHRH